MLFILFQIFVSNFDHVTCSDYFKYDDNSILNFVIIHTNAENLEICILDCGYFEEYYIGCDEKFINFRSYKCKL